MMMMMMMMMKWIISILFIFLPINLSAQLRDSVYIKNDVYEIIYSEIYEQPLSVKYTVECTNKVFSRQNIRFYTHKNIKTSDDKDYVNNIWDKGHMAPAAAFNCDSVKLVKTFSYLNCALQHQDLNRGPWKHLEKIEREYAEKYTVFVEIYLYFNNPKQTLKTGATIPNGFKKIIHIKETNEIMIFYFPNEKPKSNHILDYKI